mmetsp:Transcript_22831/g.41129  ORF Transcript_22831/g.41129 Transcript_22831/m.41129 type:complete len:225 (-) Transcript_22831:45-719(-)
MHKTDKGRGAFDIKHHDLAVGRQLGEAGPGLAQWVQSDVGKAAVAVGCSHTIEASGRGLRGVDPPFLGCTIRHRPLGSINAQRPQPDGGLEQVIKALGLGLCLLPGVAPHIEPVASHQEPIALGVGLDGCFHLLLQLVLRWAVVDDGDHQLVVVGVAPHAFHHFEVRYPELSGSLPPYHARQLCVHAVGVDDALGGWAQLVDREPQGCARRVLQAGGLRGCLEA